MTAMGRDARSVRWLFRGAVAYWVAFFVAVLWHPFALFLRVRQQLPGRTALHIGDAFGLAVTVDQQPIWVTGLSTVQTIAWLVGPPLVLWLLWVWWVARAERAAGGAPRAGAGADASALSAGAPPVDLPRASAPERSPVERQRPS